MFMDDFEDTEPKREARNARSIRRYNRETGEYYTRYGDGRIVTDEQMEDNEDEKDSDEA